MGATDDHNGLVPDIQFRGAFTSEEVVENIKETIPRFGEQLKQMFLLLALDRAAMDAFFGGLDESDALHTLQACKDTADRAVAVHEMAQAALHRALVSAGAKCGILSERAAA